MKIVRRARKSLVERRLRGLQKDLDSNLEKVELRAYQAGKAVRQRARQRAGTAFEPIPLAVRRGELTPELYEVERRLFMEAGLVPPDPPVTLAPPLAELAKAAAAAAAGAAPTAAAAGSAAGRRLVGLVPFSALRAQIEAMYRRSAAARGD